MHEICDILKLPAELIVEIMLFCDKVDVVNFAKAVEENKNDIWDIIANDKLWNYVLIPPDEEMIKNLGKCAALINTKYKYLYQH